MLTANTFQDLMGRSPLPSLQQHLALAVGCAEQIPVLMEAAFKSDRGDLKALHFRILELAQQADVVHAELSRDWPRGVLVPIRRRDLAFVLESQQRILDVCRQIAGLLQLPLEIPTEINTLMVSLAERDVKTCSRALNVTEALDTVIRTGRKGPDLARIYALVDDVRHSNSDARGLGDDLRATLHEQCKGGDAVTLVFMLELTRLLAALSRYAERASTRALLLVSR